VRIALAAFFVPFAFVYNPALLLQGSWLEIVTATVCVMAALCLLVVAAEGYWKKTVSPPSRLALAAAGLLLLSVNVYAVAAAAGLAAIVVTVERLRARQAITELPGGER